MAKVMINSQTGSEELFRGDYLECVAIVDKADGAIVKDGKICYLTVEEV